jgi:peptidyl-prolyl cis-trans isomerase A (cyclophilin A)
MVQKKSIILAVFVYVLAFMVFSLNSAHSGETDKPTKKRFTKMIANIETDLGTIKAKLFFTQAPKTVENFVGLAEGTTAWLDPKTKKRDKKPLYNGVIFHRVIKGFMIQTGDPLGNGTGGPGNPPIADEFRDDLIHNKKGILSMANSGPNTNGSQFFITLAPTPHLDNRHSVFGEVIEGMDVVEKIGATETSGPPHDRPIKPIHIKKITIERK